MNSGFLKLNLKDLSKGLTVAILAAVFSLLATALNAPGFSFATFNWGEILKIALMTGFSYLGKNLISTEDGKVLGVVG